MTMSRNAPVRTHPSSIGLPAAKKRPHEWGRGRQGCLRHIANALILCSTAAAQQYAISTIAGGPLPVPMPITQPALDLTIGFAVAVTADQKGSVYFTSNDLNSVFKLDAIGTVMRVAGNTIAGYSGDGGQATSAELNVGVAVQIVSPGGLAVDSEGNLFIADTGNHRIRRVSPEGVITTVAGTGTAGFSGDGGPAIAAQLYLPTGIALDRAGNLFISERGNNRVRRLSTGGIITTVAGTGKGSYSSVAGPGPGDGGPATGAALVGPAGLAVDASGNLFIADLYNNRVRKVSPDGVITTVAGNGAAYNSSGDGGPAVDAQVASPIGVAVDGAGNLFVLQLGYSGRVREVSPDGTISTVAGSGLFGLSGDGGPATGAALANPFAMAFDAAGNLYIADAANYRIRKISQSGIITTVAGNGGGGFSMYQGPSGDGGPARDAHLSFPFSVAADSKGNLFIADTVGQRIRQVSPDGMIGTVAGTGAAGFSGDGGRAIDAQLNGPIGLAVDGGGNLYFIDASNYRIRKISTDGTIHTIAGNGQEGFAGDGGPATSALLGTFSWCNTFCGGLAVDGGGNLWVADSGDRVRKISADGIINTVAGNGTVGYSGDGGRATDAQLAAATGVAVDNAGNLFIADGLGYVRRVSPDGIITTVAGNSGFSGPSGDGGPAANARLSAPAGVAVDGAGNLFIADPGWNFFTGDGAYQSCCDHRIRKVSPDGTITTVAGNGMAGFTGDGGPASTASLNGPVSVAVDGAGNVYVADLANNAIRVLRPTGRSLLIGAVLDAASQNADPVTPGKIVAIRGAGLGPAELTQGQPASGRFGTELSGTTVTFDGIAAPILSVSAREIKAVVPYEIAGATTQVVAVYQGNSSPAFTANVAASAPSLFTADQTGAGLALALNTIDGKPNSALNPVKIGDIVTLYATGEGQTAPGGVDGKLGGSTATHPVLPVSVTVGGISADVQYAGGAPGQIAGLMQINVQIPAGVAPGGYVPVILQVGDGASSPGVWIAVAN